MSMMKFRDYKVDKVKILVTLSRSELEEEITELLTNYDVIDLQFSIFNDFGCVHFSALALIRERSL